MTQRTFTRNYDPSPKPKNSIQCFYQSLVGWGILVTVERGEIVIKAPTGNVSPALRKAIEARKTALVAHIRGLTR